MRIIRVELSEKSKGKLRIWLEDGTCFALYRREAGGLSLEPEADLTQEQYREIIEDILIPRAKKRAMHLLEQMDRTESQLRDKLKANEYPEPVIDKAVAYMKDYHYVDDFRYACNYIRYRCQNKSRRQLACELYQKGVSKIYVEQALEAEYPDMDETAKIQKWLEKKHYDAGTADDRQKQRIYQFLLRRGFRPEDVMKML